MQKALLSVVYHSRYGHTELAARILADNLQSPYTEVFLLNVNEGTVDWDKLHASDTLIFGSPTCFGNISATFKAFMESTEPFWYKQPWKNKLAAGFTVSPCLNDEKTHALQSIGIFAAYHSMQWVSLGVMPRFLSDEQTDGQNRTGTYLGLMLQCDNSRKEVHPFHEGDLLTLELFARRLLDVTLHHKGIEAGVLAS